MTYETKMADLPRIARTIAKYQRHIDALEAKAAEGHILTTAEKDALATASANVDRHTAWALEIAERQGKDFFSIELETYHICYAFENGRWEPFISGQPIADRNAAERNALAGATAELLAAETAGLGDDAIDDAIDAYLLTNAPDHLTLGDLRRIHRDAFELLTRNRD